MKITQVNLLLSGLASIALAQDTNCSTASLNTTASTWTVTESDTIFSIAAATNRGVCDIARASRMPDAEYIDTGFVLIIPAEKTQLHVFMGPHTYTTVRNDTVTKIAMKFNIDVSAISADVISMLGVSSVDEIITAGTGMKLPQCSPSECSVQPLQFTYGVYKDLAEKYNSTVGQLFGFNTGYRYSSSIESLSPVLTIPMNCKPLSDNITIIS
ncbi:intracellular hyphae protein 1 [Botrytis cinerea]